MKRAAKTSGRIEYEPEGSDCRAGGTVSLGSGGWWSAELVVATRREEEILLTLQRRGIPGREDLDQSVDLCLRPTDLEALPVLLKGSSLRPGGMECCRAGPGPVTSGRSPPIVRSRGTS